MGKVAEDILAFILKSVLTPEVIKGSEAELVAFLKSLPAVASHPALRVLIDALAEALNIPA